MDRRALRVFFGVVAGVLFFSPATAASLLATWRISSLVCSMAAPVSPSSMRVLMASVRSQISVSVTASKAEGALGGTVIR